MSIYAIRFGKWVEIREANLPPIKKVMQEVVMVQEENFVPKMKETKYGPQITYVKEIKRKKKRMKDIVYEGGDFIFSFPYTRWTWGVRNKQLTSLDDGDMIEVPKPHSNYLLKESTRELVIGPANNREAMRNIIRGDNDDEEDYD